MGSRFKGSALRAYLLVNVATLLWAGNIALGRALREAVGPWTLACSRAVVASVLFAGLLAGRRRAKAPLERREVLLVAVMAVSGVVGFQVLQYAGLRHTTALNAGLVNATAPLMTLLLSRALLQQALASSQIMGALLSLFGVATVLTNGSWEALWKLRFNPGDLLVLAAVSLWGVYSIAGRAALRHQPTAWITGLSTMAAVPMLLAPAAWECSSIRPSVQPFLFFAILYIGVGPSFLAFLAWNEGVKRLGPNGAMAFYNTLPVYAGVLAGVGLREWPGPPVLFGGFLVVGGCLLATRFATSSAGGPTRRDRSC